MIMHSPLMWMRALDESCTTALSVFQYNLIIFKSILNKRISTYISETLLELANYWLDNDDQGPITSDVFAKRITMGELAFRSDGSIESIMTMMIFSGALYHSPY